MVPIGSPVDRALQLHTGGAELVEGGLGGRLGDAGGQGEQHAGAEPVADGVERGGPDAVVGGDADDVDVGHAAVAQPLGERDAVLGPLEARVGGGVLALVEDGLERLAVEGRVQLDAVGADDAVRRPGLEEVGLLGEVPARVDVVVPGGDDVGVLAGRRARAR